MKRTVLRRAGALLLAGALSLALSACASLAKEDAGAGGDTLIGYYAVILTSEELEKAGERSSELTVSATGQLQFRENPIPADFDRETGKVTCGDLPGYGLGYLLEDDCGQNFFDPCFTENSTAVHVGQGVTLQGTLVYDTTGVAGGVYEQFDHEPTAADFGGGTFTVYQVDEDGDGETDHWEGRAGEELYGSIYAVYETAEGGCYLKKTAANMTLEGESEGTSGASSALSVSNEVRYSYSTGESSTEFLKAEVRFLPSRPYELRRITQFDENHRAVSVTEIDPNEPPESIAWEEGAAYMMAERSYTDESGALRSTYDTITEESSCYTYPVWNGARVAEHRGIILTGRGA
ncbi:MAG: hypothetical protein ACI3WR_04480 [Oscillospiraceae bacterium]